MTAKILTNVQFVALLILLKQAQKHIAYSLNENMQSEYVNFNLIQNFKYKFHM